MALDPHPDREPGHDARIITDPDGTEYAKSQSGVWVGLGGYGENWQALTWTQLAERYPDAVVWLP